MADIRSCQQCGGVFEPRREHSRFCSVACRVAWNREHMGDPADEFSALQWSVTGMSESVERLAGASAPVRRQALVLIGEAVWWVTIVDATLVRHLPTYDSVMTGQGPQDRRETEATLAGLRFVRNQLGHQVDLAELAQPGPGSQRVRDWTWQPVPEPSLVTFPRRGWAWEMTRYQAYQAQLVGHAVGEIFGRAVAFLRMASADAVSATDPRLQATL